jgi:hypothetical protein
MLDRDLAALYGVKPIRLREQVKLYGLTAIASLNSSAKPAEAFKSIHLCAYAHSILRRRVKRNLKRFPEDFMFQLTREEALAMVSQNAIPSWKHLGGYLPYVFTEHGVAMLSSVLNSERAIQVNIAIMRAFAKLRQILATHKELVHKLEQLEQKVSKNSEDIQLIFRAIHKLMNPPIKTTKKIGFKVNDK